MIRYNEWVFMEGGWSRVGRNKNIGSMSIDESINKMEGRSHCTHNTSIVRLGEYLSESFWFQHFFHLKIKKVWKFCFCQIHYDLIM